MQFGVDMQAKNELMLDLIKKIKASTCPEDLKIPLPVEYIKEVTEALEENKNLLSVRIAFVISQFVDYTPFRQILERNHTLKCLHLMLVTGEHFNEIAEGLKKNSSLENLFLGASTWSDFGDKPMVDIFSALKINKNLTILRIPSTNFSLQAAQFVLACLQDEHCAIQSLHLQDCTIEGSKIALINLMSQALAKNKSIKHIDLSGMLMQETVIDSCSAFRKLIDVLNKNNTTLNSLSLASVIGASAQDKIYFVNVMVKILRENKNITELDISRNHLSRCDLWRENFVSDNALHDCEVDPTSRSKFLQALSENSTLTQLNVTDTGINSYSAQDIASVLETNYSMLDIPKFNDHHADVVWEEAIQPLLERNQYMVFRPKMRVEIKAGLEILAQNSHACPPVDNIIYQYMKCEENPKVLQDLVQKGISVPAVIFSIAGNKTSREASIQSLQKNDNKRHPSPTGRGFGGLPP